MATAILMPKMGLTMKNATVVKWLKEEGDPLREKEPVMEIETEKLINQVESPCDGILLKKVAKEGERYEIAAVLGYVGKAGEAMKTPHQNAANSPPNPRRRSVGCIAPRLWPRLPRRHPPANACLFLLWPKNSRSRRGSILRNFRAPVRTAAS